jgi:hypothetical protein
MRPTVRNDLIDGRLRSFFDVAGASQCCPPRPEGTCCQMTLNTLARLSPCTASSHSHTQPNGVSHTW